jgi:hypothetical protein
MKKKTEKTTEKREEQAFYSRQDRNALPQPPVEGREVAQSPASASRKVQLGPPVIEEGEVRKGEPRIQDGSHHLKLTDRRARVGVPTVRLTEHSGSAP